MDGKEFRSKYFHTPRRTELPKDVIEKRNEKYKKMQKPVTCIKIEKGNER